MKTKTEEEYSLEQAMQDTKESDHRLMSIVGSSALAKAIQDPFDYALKLKTGEVIRFDSANLLNNEWVRLTIKDLKDQPEENRIPFPGPRGVDVRMSEIVWVMDAPEDS